ncbi:MAG: molybdopterin molybdotransferase MoeA [Alphaproteobacteria bacterium]|nr:MAG: molybdopterin molybdotransferase MoeA [Alphaproteobacteria bacterium]
MISFDEAVALIAEAARPLGRETVPLDEAHGRVLAGHMRARRDAPSADVSAMDGYAVREADLPGRLRVAGESFPGRGFAGTMHAGECVRIFTGAPLPPGAGRVVIQEDVSREGEFAGFAAPAGEARHIRRRGSDFAARDLLLEPGRRLDARALVVVAAADIGEVEVFRRPLVALLATGDELVEPGEGGGLPDSVSPGVAALLADWGGEVSARRRLRDDPGEMRRAAGEPADLLVVTGGASVGERDFARAMFDGLDLIFSKVAIKPGKPAWLGRAGGRLVIGLPGNPTSAMVTARLLLAPLLAGLTGRAPAEALRWRSAPLAEGLGPCGDRETFVRARYDGETARPLRNQDSGAQKMLADADLLIRRRLGAPAAAKGEVVEILDF